MSFGCRYPILNIKFKHMITYTFCECAWCDILVTWLRRLMGWVIILYTGWWLVSVSVGGVQAGLQTIIPITICTTGRETRLTHCTVSPCHCHTHTLQPQIFSSSPALKILLQFVKYLRNPEWEWEWSDDINSHSWKKTACDLIHFPVGDALCLTSFL